MLNRHLSLQGGGRRPTLTAAAPYCRPRSSRLFLPELSDRGGGDPLSGSSSSEATLVCKTVATNSRVLIVTFSEPRSTRPTYDRSMPASRASLSCDQPFATRNLRRFHPMILRAFMPAIDDDCGLTIDGLSVPDLAEVFRRIARLGA